MFNFNSLKKLLLFLVLLSFKNIYVKDTTSKQHLLNKLNNVSKTNAREIQLKNIIQNLRNLSSQLDIVTTEFEKINPVILKNAFIIGISKYFRGIISITELKQLTPLQNQLTEKAPGEILNFITKVASNKTFDYTTKQEIEKLKAEFLNKFKLKINTTDEKIIHLMKSNTVVMKIFNSANTNISNLKNLLNHIIKNCFKPGSTKTNLEQIANNIDVLVK